MFDNSLIFILFLYNHYTSIYSWSRCISLRDTVPAYLRFQYSRCIVHSFANINFHKFYKLGHNEFFKSKFKQKYL